MLALFTDRRATAALEFALVLPVMVALTLGLAGSVRHSLAEIDADAAASAGALMALEAGYAPGRIAAAAQAADPATRVDSVHLIECGRKRRACAGLPAGRYVRVSTSREAASYLQPLAPERVHSTALVRLHGDKT